MIRRHLLVIGPVPPPIHGESLAIKHLIESEDVRTSFRLTVVNTNRKRTNKGGHFSLTKIFQDIGIMLHVLRIVRRNPVDIMYLSLSQTRLGLLRDTLLIRLTGKKAGRVVAHLHGNNLRNVLTSMNPLMEKFVVNALGSVESGIVLSRKLAFNFMGLPSHIEIIPNGIDSGYFTAKEVESARSQKLHDSRFHILYLSNLIESKGFAQLILATMDLLNENDQVELWLAGQIYDRQLFDKMMHEVTAAGYDSKIVYLGTVTGAKKKQLLSDADVMVLPTKYPVEGQPISIIEGMASGLPIISSVQGAIPELIEGNGVALKEISRASLAAAIKQLMTDRDLYRRFSINSRQHFLRHYTLDHYIGGLIATFNRGD
ncbi:glycosyltransferase family 4 protein [Sporolactobacillus pectinivorans]|uniref:glycosyltransferase family 4 protein n=1 Tax=Sporolactobacillus pectinivorans TaxID=1591408 RepID=UPI000C25C46C|nr:glycosyltransferase family 4 protein [Sporolactobacillus pectinivorans]